MAELRAEIAAGRVQHRSAEWYRLRERARRKDPEFIAMKNAKQREKWDRGREKRAAEAARRKAMREKERERNPVLRGERRKFECVQKRPHMVRAKTEDERRVDAVVAAAQDERCAGWVQDRGYRVRCMLAGDHAGRCVFRRTA